MRGAIIGAALLALLGSNAEAQDRRRIGPWEVTTERNRFGDGNNIVIASTVQGGTALVVRCLAERSFSLGILELGIGTGRLQQGMRASAMVRVDNNPIENPSAGVVNDRLVQINLPIEKAEQMLRGREIAVRLQIGTGGGDQVFRLTQAQRALAPVFEACRVPQPLQRAEAEGYFDFDRAAAHGRMQEVLSSNRTNIVLPQFNCGTAAEESRTCSSAVGSKIEVQVWEARPENGDVDAFRKGEGPGNIETLHVGLSASGASQSERANFVMLCGAALRAASPNEPLRTVQRRIEAAINDARRTSQNTDVGVGTSSSATDILEIEIVKPNTADAELNCIVHAKGR